MAEALTSEKVTVQSATKQIRDNFTQLRVRSGEVEYVGEGMDNIVFRAKHDYLFRFAKDAGTSMQNEKEIQLLSTLQKALSLRIPNVEYAALQPNGFYFFGYKEVKGMPLTNQIIAAMEPKTKEDTVQTLATFLQELRRFPAEEALDVGIAERNLKKFVGDTWDKYVANFTSHFSGQEQKRLSTTFEEYLSDENNFKYSPCLVHADLGPEHILFDDKAQTISGVIDWSDMVVTDPAFEMQDLYQNFGEDFTRDILQKMDADVEMEVKHASFFTMVRNLQRFMRRIQSGDARAEINLATVKRELGNF